MLVQAFLLISSSLYAANAGLAGHGAYGAGALGAGAYGAGAYGAGAYGAGAYGGGAYAGYRGGYDPYYDGTPKPFAFNYVAPAIGGQSARQEAGDGSGRVTGSYSLVDNDGRTRVVNYIADGSGFHAQVNTNEPGTKSENPADVVVNSAAPATVYPSGPGGYGAHGGYGGYGGAYRGAYGGAYGGYGGAYGGYGGAFGRGVGGYGQAGYGKKW